MQSAWEPYRCSVCFESCYDSRCSNLYCVDRLRISKTLRPGTPRFVVRFHLSGVPCKRHVPVWSELAASSLQATQPATPEFQPSINENTLDSHIRRTTSTLSQVQRSRGSHSEFTTDIQATIFYSLRTKDRTYLRQHRPRNPAVFVAVAIAIAIPGPFRSVPPRIGTS